MNSLTKIGIWVAIVGALFGLLWWQGYILRLRTYWTATVEELKKCTWPTWDELKGSTVLVTIAFALLGLFTMAVDWIFVHVVFWISKT